MLSSRKPNKWPKGLVSKGEAFAPLHDGLKGLAVGKNLKHGHRHPLVAPVLKRLSGSQKLGFYSRKEHPSVGIHHFSPNGYGVKAIHPDKFVLSLLELDSADMCKAVKSIVPG
jgi:hypothetical protein